MKDGLGLKNILHIAELCIAVPLSNTESERVFSYSWRQLSQECMSFNYQALEQVLQIRQVKDFSIENYNHAIKLFLSIYPNGDVCKQPRRVGGIDYPKNKQEKKSTGDQPNSKFPSLEHIYQLLKDLKLLKILILNSFHYQMRSIPMKAQMMKTDFFQVYLFFEHES